MPRVYISVGSNIDREKNIRAALRGIRDLLSDLRVSSVYESEPVGFAGENFFNLVVAGETVLSPQAVAEQLANIEAKQGRVRDGARFGARTLDLDLLLYDALVLQDERLTLPREEILQHAFVLCPLAEIAASERHPVLAATFGDLWRAFENDGQRLWRIDFPD